MLIMGIGNSTNSSVTLIENSTILYSAQEERFSRVKQDKKYPFLAIENCLDFCSLKEDDIEYVVCGGWKNPDRDTLEDYFNAVQNGYPFHLAAEKMYYSMKNDFGYRENFYLNTARLFRKAKIDLYEHHITHAYSAFYLSPFENSYILTCDGRGDSQSVAIWKADRENGIKKIKSFSELKSLGALYGQITGVLGFKPDRHEGKITGLAAYGKNSKMINYLSKMIRYDKLDIQISPDYKPFLTHEYEKLKNFIATEGIIKEDIAYSVQFILEDIIINIINSHIPNNSNLCLAGGVFGNVKLNQRIRELCQLNDYFITPEMGDGGMSLGSAIAESVKHGKKYFDFQNVFLGPSFSWDDVDLSKYKVKQYSNLNECANIASDLIINGCIVGIFTGRMEFGPRALGSRSIMLEAKEQKINDIVNKRLNRTEFMPFAPVTLENYADEMYENFNKKDINTSYMTTCYNCTQLMKNISPAVVHIDGTARPQIISEKFHNKLYYQILSSYHKKTGIPNLVNTSFNNHEEPIVCKPQDALDSLEKNNLDFIITDTMIIGKKDF